MQADVTKTEDVQNYVNRAVEVYGRIDFFFNNAGIVQKFSMLDDIDEDEFDRQMSVNVKGAFLGMKYVLKVMKEQGSGHIVNTASTAGIRASTVRRLFGKQACGGGLDEGSALEYVKQGIRVNAICPGGVQTPLTAAVAKSFMEGATCLRKWATCGWDARLRRMKSRTWWLSWLPRLQLHDRFAGYD